MMEFINQYIPSFLSGFLLATIFFWIIHRKQQQCWHTEFRRMMGGIYLARDKVLNLNVTRGEVAEILSKTWLGDKI